MTIEAGLAAITTSTTGLLATVVPLVTDVKNAVAGFAATTSRVNTGLNRVDNTPDTEKPVSVPAQEALATKQETLVDGENISTVNGQSLLSGLPLVIARSATSLNKVAYAARGTLRTTSPEVDDGTMVEGLGLFMWVNSLEEPDDDETCFTTATGQWLLQAPAWELISAWALYETAVTDDWREDEPARFAAYLLNK